MRQVNVNTIVRCACVPCIISLVTLVACAGGAVRPAVVLEAEPFDVADVRLLDGSFKAAMETDKAYLLNLDPNRLLSFLQKQAELLAGTDPLLGWKDAKIGAEGADWSLGHYLSACSQMYRSTREPHRG